MNEINVIPDIDDPNVGRMITEIHCSNGGILSNASPVIIMVRPEKHTEVNDCFPTVDRKIKRDGGERVLGWTLRKESFVMSAEFHAVWKSPNGELLDVAFKGLLVPGGENIVFPTDKIMFIIAPHAKYEGKQVANININLSGNPLVDDLISCSKCIFNINNKGERAFQYGEIILDGEEAKQFDFLQQFNQGLTMMLKSGIKSKNATCFCNSGEKYKHCHGKTLRRIVK